MSIQLQIHKNKRCQQAQYQYSIDVKIQQLQLSSVTQHSAQKHPGIPPAGPGPSQMTSRGYKKFNVCYQYFVGVTLALGNIPQSQLQLPSSPVCMLDIYSLVEVSPARLWPGVILTSPRDCRDVSDVTSHVPGLLTSQLLLLATSAPLTTADTIFPGKNQGGATYQTQHTVDTSTSATPITNLQICSALKPYTLSTYQLTEGFIIFLVINFLYPLKILYVSY